ncbi:serine protease inhibitor ecotin [Zophobihabitans entericus]|uniref:Serine protease inhibitor ecotin n=1 Tax=Zophobihabitans entericus TaxID=1635327 RepID=A0A6G9IBK4_9GAMM|nr:serine protease inhibitor ecotin [Zophobihabitans entericus]QIQ21611.1 serine protease inhibitor ecotin [Zophobihabitans entericus]
MKKLMALVLPCVLLAACSMPAQQTRSQSVNEVAPYPEAQAGYTRSVIYLPELKNEENAKVELVIGKDTEVDCNSQFYTGTVKEETLNGWGYNYYVVEKVNGPVSTLMACLNAEKQTKFVTLNSNLDLLRYNSKLPIVVYAPSDLQVKYRVWTQSDSAIPATIE